MVVVVVVVQEEEVLLLIQSSEQTQSDPSYKTNNTFTHSICRRNWSKWLNRRNRSKRLSRRIRMISDKVQGCSSRSSRSMSHWRNRIIGYKVQRCHLSQYQQHY